MAVAGIMLRRRISPRSIARSRAAVALDADGHFLALRVETLANLGAYVSTFGAAIPSAIYSSLLAGPYRTPAIHVTVTGVFTTTLPTLT